MKKILTLSSLATLAIVLGMVSWGSKLNAQTAPSSTPDQQTAPAQAPDTTPSQQTPSAQPTPSPEMPPATQQAPSTQAPSSSQSPDATTPDSKSGSSATSDSASGSQTFSGTVVKQGDKYMLKDDTGKTYDIDHQTDVAKFEGKRVRVQGTLDASGKIMVK